MVLKSTKKLPVTSDSGSHGLKFRDFKKKKASLPNLTPAVFPERKMGNKCEEIHTCHGLFFTYFPMN